MSSGSVPGRRYAYTHPYRMRAKTSDVTRPIALNRASGVPARRTNGDRSAKCAYRIPTAWANGLHVSPWDAPNPITLPDTAFARPRLSENTPKNTRGAGADTLPGFQTAGAASAG